MLIKSFFSILIAMYYWMWARNDWKDYYTTVQDVIFAFSFYYFVSRAIRVKKYKQESPDEMAEANLWRCDAICLKNQRGSFYCDWLYLRCRPYGSYHRNHRLWLDGRTDFDFGGAHDHLLSYG